MQITDSRWIYFQPNSYAITDVDSDRPKTLNERKISNLVGIAGEEENKMREIYNFMNLYDNSFKILDVPNFSQENF